MTSGYQCCFCGKDIESNEENVTSLILIANWDKEEQIDQGGGVIGGFAHENVRIASIAFVNKFQEYIPSMVTTDMCSLPSQGMVNFYALTNGGVRHQVESEATLQAYGSVFSALYAFGQNVITELRVISEQ